MSVGYQEGSGYPDELHFYRTFDALTDEMQGICRQLITLKATRSDHLKLKISALLYLLPDEADTEVELAKSLLADIEGNIIHSAAAARD
jgi:hypothetical protein